MLCSDATRITERWHALEFCPDATRPMKGQYILELVTRSSDRQRALELCSEVAMIKIGRAHV